jgi:hypothetical protein
MTKMLGLGLFGAAQGSIDGRAGDQEHLCEIADGILARAVHPAQFVLLRVRQLRFLAAQISLWLG